MPNSPLSHFAFALMLLSSGRVVDSASLVARADGQSQDESADRCSTASLETRGSLPFGDHPTMYDT